MIKAMVAKKTSKCACGYKIHPGQTIVFERHTGKWVHLECYTRPPENEDQQKLEF